jgi:hypothetical protein
MSADKQQKDKIQNLTKVDVQPNRQNPVQKNLNRRHPMGNKAYFLPFKKWQMNH